ncbi:alpha/beta hydrolase fold protein [Natronomonas pharaonis DSM 2160]|uniref:Alpha/beta hydrolase fold protein n=1 Tax=Natronomonas pharaonis (strain ATCC 35678 / DSM 2160 / CIP 103997 / JCM 8858 / NBRC 14720 / NCIMB 2260 / Gabara) TaxID=348780 RepID=A0A1U7EVL7_NATPD|nr:dienelactone hydrolase family protein [Natronomonas pharaonis]CAI49074.1 alpha/beta hydrolase fold protein [Natronomonas pharaonis DSM 2160]
MSKSVVVPADRDIRGTLDAPDADRCVVACPPHPQHGGNRNDPRLEAVSDDLDAACLRFDYGPWDEGRGELEDVRAAYAWARERYDAVGLFGYSFGGCLALVAAAAESEAGTPPSAVAVLSPAASLAAGELDAVAAVADIDAPMALVYGERDTMIDATAVADALTDAGGDVASLPADHFFVGQTQRVGAAIAAFFNDGALPDSV